MATRFHALIARITTSRPATSASERWAEAAGARLVPVPIDNDGLVVEVGARASPHARLAYVTPSHQFPLGAVMSAPRRLALLAWASSSSSWILEDDYDSEFRYAGRPLPSLQGLDAEASHAGGSLRVLYVGTFSKTLVPGLRLGYLVVPDALVDAFRAARVATDLHTATPTQHVLADFIGEGHYARHIRRVRALCGARQAVLLSAAATQPSGLITLEPDAAGLHLVGRLPAGVDDRRAAALAEAEGVHVSTLSRFTLAPRPRGERAPPGLRGLRRAPDPRRRRPPAYRPPPAVRHSRAGIASRIPVPTRP